MCGVLRTDRAFLYECKQALVATGRWPESGQLDKATLRAAAAAASGKMPVKTEVSSVAPATKVKDETPPPANDDEGSSSVNDQPIGDWRLSTTIHRNFKTWDKVPPAQLRRLITSLSPISCSTNNLKGYMSKGMREVPRAPLAQL